MEVYLSTSPRKVGKELGGRESNSSGLNRALVKSMHWTP